MFHYVAQQDTADCKWLQRSIAKLKVESNTTMSEQHEQAVDRITLPMSVRAEHERQSHRPDSKAHAKTWEG